MTLMSFISHNLYQCFHMGNAHFWPWLPAFWSYPQYKIQKCKKATAFCLQDTTTADEMVIRL